MVHRLPSLCLLCALSLGTGLLGLPRLGAQVLVRADGGQASLTSVRVGEDTVVFPSGPGQREPLTVPIKQLRMIIWPLPAEVKEAETDLAEERYAEVLRKTTAALNAQEKFRAVPGSGWPRMASLRVAALAGSGRLDAAEQLLATLRTIPSVDDVAARAELAVIEVQAARGELEKYRPRLAALRNALSDRTSRARLSLLAGDAHLKAGRAEDALLDFLYVRVFPAADDTLRRRALTGAAAAADALGEPKLADTLRDELNNPAR